MYDRRFGKCRIRSVGNSVHPCRHCTPNTVHRISTGKAGRDCGPEAGLFDANTHHAESADYQYRNGLGGKHLPESSQEYVLFRYERLSPLAHTSCLVHAHRRRASLGGIPDVCAMGTYS